MVYKVLGPDDTKKIVVDQKSIFYQNTGQGTEAMVRGSAVITLGIRVDKESEPYEKAGLKFDFRRIGNTAETAYETTGGSVLAMINRPPHPNVAKLFANWLLSKEVQTEFTKADQFNSIRADVPPIDPAGVPQKGQNYLEVQKESMVAEKQKAQDFIRSVRP
jgi:ABC-type glycerol-3-phosphate transport system substrate-binding protein